MKLRWKDSTMYTSDQEYDKEYLKIEEKFLNDRLKSENFIFLNDVLKSLGFKQVKRGQYDGWLYEQQIKLRVKEENGELYLNLNEEMNIVDDAFIE